MVLLVFKAYKHMNVREITIVKDETHTSYKKLNNKSKCDHKKKIKVSVNR